MSVAVVVGASGAIGRHVVTRLRAEGQRVLAVARDPERLRALAVPGAVDVLPLDVTDDDAGDRLVASLDTDVHLLAYLASAPLGGDVLTVPGDVVRRALAVKVEGLLRLVQSLVERFADPARVVAVGGNLGLDPTPAASTAGIANAAQANLVRQLDRALARRGVTCHTVAPGPVDTERYRTLAAATAAQRGVAVETVVAEAAEQASIGRLTTPEEVAWAVVRLTDPEAAALAGSTLLLDGGRRTAIP